MQTGSVDEDDLEVVAMHDPTNGVPGGLRARRRDCHFRPDQRIGQRGLAGVRRDQTHKARMEFGHAGFLAEREHRETFPAFFRRECTFGVIAGYLPDR